MTSTSTTSPRAALRTLPRPALAGVAASLLLVGAATWYWARPAQAAQAAAPATAPAVPVTTVQVQQRDVPVLRAGVGTVGAMASVTVKARIDGQLEKVAFTEGQDVKQGQLLAQLDARTLEAQLAQAQAQKARDEATLANARMDLQRYTTLIAQDAATRQQLDTQKALVTQLEAAVQTDGAQVQYAQVQLSFSRIAAPISGRVGARLVDPGNIVHASDANGLVVINQIDPINVVFTLPEDAVQDIHRAQRGDKRPLKVQAFARSGGEPLATGELILVNNQIDTATGTVQLKARFANPDHVLWPGQYVNVRLQLGRREQALTVPAAAIQRSQTGPYVYVVDDEQKAQNRPVQVAQITDDVAVVTGLEARQRVVIDGQYKLKPGASVVESARGAGGAGGAKRAAGAASAPAAQADAGDRK